ncbi:MAG: hypothetical protein NZ750_07370 [Anaerolineae bacterium]|nr:hypothetical protein [Anaerolineae bacterium]MDW8172167.1 hypothetical protein [Anaerolineae bacterium]
MSTPAPQAGRAPLALLLLLGCLPALLAWGVAWIVHGAPLTTYRPQVTNDTVLYYRYAYTFSQVGLGGAPYGSDEYTAPWPVLGRFGAHGPALVGLYGTWLALMGTEPYKIHLFHAAWVALAFVVLARVGRWTTRQVFWAAAALSTCAYLLFGLTNFLQEAFHSGAALLLAALAIDLGRRKQVSAGRALLYAALLFWLAWTRMTWAFLFVPLLLGLLRPRTLGRWLLALSLALSLALAALGLFNQTTPPGNNAVLAIIRNLLSNLPSVISMLARHLFNTIESWLNFSWPTPLIPLLFIALAVVAYVQLARQRRRDERALWGLILYSLFVVSAFTLAFYLGAFWSRIGSPFFLFCLMLLAHAGKTRTLAPLIVGQLIILAWFPLMISSETPDYHPDAARIADFERAATLIVLDDDPPSDWCNTLLVDGRLLDGRLVGLPPALGVHFLRVYDNFEAGVRSRYVWLSQAALTRLDEASAAPLALRPIAQHENFTLYLNERSACPS